MNIGRRCLEAGILAVCLVAVVVILRPMLSAHLHADEARSEFMAVFNGIRVGASHRDVEAVVNGSPRSRLRLVRLGATEWLVDSPLQFGATNWQLWVEFEGQAVSALRIRTADDRHVTPDDAPADRVLDGEQSSHNTTLERSSGVVDVLEEVLWATPLVAQGPRQMDR